MSERRTHRVAIVPGDGIGPEVTAEALKVLEAASSIDGFALDGVFFDLGAERYLRTGEVLPDSSRDELSSFDAVLLGAVGDPRVPPGVLEAGLLLRLRQDLDLYVNLRPARLFPGVRGPLSPAGKGIDVVLVRENTEGLYAGKGASESSGTERETATEISINTAPAVTRIIRFAFELAQIEGRKLTLVHKTNVLAHAGALYTRIFSETAAAFPSVPTEYQHVDAAALLMASDPGRFSAIVTDNLFGDVLSDLTAALAGGIGFVGSGNIHPGKTSLFEPVHGSAPDIAGTGRANPMGAILSAALMLRHLGEDAAAGVIDNAVAGVAGEISVQRPGCAEIGDAVAGAVAASSGMAGTGTDSLTPGN